MLIGERFERTWYHIKGCDLRGSVTRRGKYLTRHQIVGKSPILFDGKISRSDLHKKPSHEKLNHMYIQIL